MSKRTHVLYVDDEPDLLELGKLFLEADGHFVVDTRASAAEALATLTTGRYDAIISDYLMPEMDGITFLKQVRGSGSTIPFILFTGRGREEVVVEAINNGVDFYLQKGGDPTAQFTELAHKIRLAVERRRAEQALAESESRFRDLTENSVDTIMLFDRDLRHIYVNPNVEKETGIPPEQFIGRTHAELGFPPDLCRLWEQTLKKAFMTGEIQRIEFQIPTGFWIDWQVVPIHGPDGAVVQVITSARDITERKKAEKQIRLAEFSLEHSGIPTIWLGEDARIIRANKAACDDLGYTREEFTQLRAYDFDPLYPPEKWKLLWERIASEKYVVIESIHKRKDGTTFPVEISGTFFEYEGEKIIHSFSRDITERKRAEIAIRESEAKYRTLFEKSKDAMLILDNNRFVDCNAATLAMLGMTGKDQFVALHPSAISPPVQPDGRDSYEKAEEFMATALREGSLRFEWLHKRMNGEPFWAEVSLTAIPFGDKKIIHTSWRDITDRKKAEAGLRAAYEQITVSEEELRAGYDELAKSEQRIRESEEKYRVLVENIPFGITLIDTDHRIILSNAAQGQMFHTDPRVWPGRYCFREFEKRDAVCPHCPGTRAMATGTCSEVETEGVRDDGTRFNAHIRAIPLPDPQGHITGFIEIVEDITERKKAEDALRQNEEKYRAIIENMEDMFYRTDRDGKIIMVNPSAAGFAGFSSPEELIGADIRQFYSNPADHELFVAEIERNGSVSGYPVFFRRRDGTIRTVAASSHYYYDSSGTVAGVEGILHDVTALQEANKKLNLLSSITRHDINNQLTVLQGYLSVLSERNEDTSDTEMLSRALAAAVAIQHQIAFTSDYQDIGVKSPRWQDVGEIIRQVADELPHEHIAIESQLGNLEVYADPLFVKVVYSLIDNAIRYGETITKIRFSCQEYPDFMNVVCEDNGVGISDEDKAHLFTKGFGKNTGLGLFLSREILGITGLTIQETGEPGRGARFEITVPKRAWRSSEKPV